MRTGYLPVALLACLLSGVGCAVETLEQKIQNGVKKHAIKLCELSSGESLSQGSTPVVVVFLDAKGKLSHTALGGKPRKISGPPDQQGTILEEVQPGPKDQPEPVKREPVKREPGQSVLELTLSHGKVRVRIQTGAEKVLQPRQALDVGELTRQLRACRKAASAAITRERLLLRTAAGVNVREFLAACVASRAAGYQHLYLGRTFDQPGGSDRPDPLNWTAQLKKLAESLPFGRMETPGGWYGEVLFAVHATATFEDIWRLYLAAAEAGLYQLGFVYQGQGAKLFKLTTYLPVSGKN